MNIDDRPLITAYHLASAALDAADWRGLAGEIARTGDEDPLALVDDPDMRAVIAVKMQLRRSREAKMFQELDQDEKEFCVKLLDFEDSMDSHRLINERKIFLAKISGQVKHIIAHLRSSKSPRDQNIARLHILEKFKDLSEPFCTSSS